MRCFPSAYCLAPRNAADQGPLSPQLGFARVGQLELSKSDISDFDRERAGVKGYGLLIEHNPSPGAARRPLPMGEVKLSPEMRFDRFNIGPTPCRARSRARC